MLGISGCVFVLVSWQLSRVGIIVNLGVDIQSCLCGVTVPFFGLFYPLWILRNLCLWAASKSLEGILGRICF